MDEIIDNFDNVSASECGPTDLDYLDNLDNTTEGEGEGEEDEDDGDDNQHVGTHTLTLLTSCHRQKLIIADIYILKRIETVSYG